MLRITAIVVISIFFTIFIVSGVIGEELYSDKYDYVNVDAILANPRLRNQYYKCFANIGPCLTADAKFFKESLPQAILTNCRRCTARQSINFDKITDWYTKNEPEKYDEIVAKAVKHIQEKASL